MGNTTEILSESRIMGAGYMIFVSVGTHEQGFDRLVSKMDKLKRENLIIEPIYIQLGYGKYIPMNCEFIKLMSYEEMIRKVNGCSIYITHGGPGSIFLGLQYGKIPIVVPRQKIFHEHVDNHQVHFVRQMEKEKRIIAVYDIDDLENKIMNYLQFVQECRISGSHSKDIC